MMTDQEIIQKLIARDNQVTEDFFFVKCRPLFLNIIKKVFDYEVDYEEFVNELYLYLMDEDAKKLRNFEYRSSIYQWLKVLAIRYFIKKRNNLIDDSSDETLYEETKNQPTDDIGTSAKGDLNRLFMMMPNKRYVHVIKRLVIEDWEPELLAEEMNVTVDNLYNIKRRAMAQLTQIALKDKREYEKK